MPQTSLDESHVVDPGKDVEEALPGPSPVRHLRERTENEATTRAFGTRRLCERQSEETMSLSLGPTLPLHAYFIMPAEPSICQAFSPRSAPLSQAKRSVFAPGSEFPRLDGDESEKVP
jgi:hypothetical protein